MSIIRSQYVLYPQTHLGTQSHSKNLAFSIDPARRRALIEIPCYPLHETKPMLIRRSQFCVAALGIGSALSAAAAQTFTEANWTALGSGMGGTVYLAVSGSDLYAGGSFTTAGGNAASHIAKWDGSSWT